ncbi:hypothetical protein C7434_3505 [Pantoea sp. PNA 14-12]|uniref:hypothetical protein n=1 Tax=Pantoea TaxID=53335 RepID=UPI00050FE511|nr:MULTISPECIES: hypothetical protein [Pantoea]KGD79924.1 hypothetical protein HA47_21815 [Pantoea stewartii subsp. indologenes]TDS67766.1 hypothetical protein C7434_3505 [Pantoea sp. PNA 14-12]
MAKVGPKFIVPVIIVLACLAWWLVPHYDAEEEAYYVSVLCTVPQQNEHQIYNAMNNVIEGSNSDYALQKIHFIPGLAKRVITVWKNLTPDQQQLAASNNTQCQHLLTHNK